MSKTKKNKKKVSKNLYKSRKSMKGGFTPDEIDYLLSQGFSSDEINQIDQLNIPMDIVNAAIDYYHANSFPLIIKIAQDLNEIQTQNVSNESDGPIFQEDDLNISGISNVPDENEQHNLDDNEEDILDNNNNNNNDFLDDTGNTSFESYNSLGGKRYSKKRKIRFKKIRKSRTMKGGMCYGNGVGANSYNPNYSIYNTNLLKLFPYKT
jgi:hypothetical protein